MLLWPLVHLCIGKFNTSKEKCQQQKKVKRKYVLCCCGYTARMVHILPFLIRMTYHDIVITITMGPY